MHSCYCEPLNDPLQEVLSSPFQNKEMKVGEAKYLPKFTEAINPELEVDL